MPAMLNLLFALIGVGALGASAGGGGGGGDDDPVPSDPVADPSAQDKDEQDLAVGQASGLSTATAVGPTSTPAIALSDAPDLADSAYALTWQGLTAQEQYMLELVNRARMDPEAEADRTGDAVDSGATSSSKQALAVDPILSAAADNHSEDMLDRNFFDHTNPDGDSPTDRAQDEGWPGGGVWENISARWTNASSVSNEQSWVDASHEGLWESDGHQFGMLQDSHTVVGIGIDWGEWSYPGPTYPNAMLATQNFANDGQTYLTGVVIDDADNDDFYDIGEGQGGVHITVWNDLQIYTSSTWDSGGYSIAVNTGTYNVRFEGGDLATAFETSVTIGDQNVKLDVNEDDLGLAVMSGAPGVSQEEDQDPVTALFLSAQASREVIDREAKAADAYAEPETDDVLAMI